MAIPCFHVGKKSLRTSVLGLFILIVTFWCSMRLTLTAMADVKESILSVERRLDVESAAVTIAKVWNNRTADATSHQATTTPWVATKLHGLKWPQMDNRTAIAITNGIRLNIDANYECVIDPANNVCYYDCEHYNVNASGTKCEAPTPGLATLVTAYYWMRSKHSWADYGKWLEYVTSATEPMIVFVEPNSGPHSGWGEFIMKMRKHAPTIIVPMHFANFTMSTRFSEDFWQKDVLDRDILFKALWINRGVSAYKIFNERIIMMHEVARLNPFNTEHIFWIDAGYYRQKNSAPNYAPIIRNNITANGVKRDQVVFQHVDNPWSNEIAGGAWGGTPPAIFTAYDRYFETFWWMVVNKYETVGHDQNVIMLMCQSFPNICNIHTSHDYFAMGKIWLRDANFDFSRSFELLLDPKHNATGSTKHNATGNLVQTIRFPTEPVIYSSSS